MATNEQVWFAGTDSVDMLHCLAILPPRKTRLLCVAIVRRLRELLPFSVFHQIIDLSEKYAEEMVDTQTFDSESVRLEFQFRELKWDWQSPYHEDIRLAVIYLLYGELDKERVERILRYARGSFDEASVSVERRLQEHLAQLRLFLDVFGNPFRPVSVNPAWWPPTAKSLALAAYGERDLLSGQLDLARLAVLADALEEAGCSSETILEHLRDPRPHVRGCWAVDLILGKK